MPFRFQPCHPERSSALLQRVAALSLGVIGLVGPHFALAFDFDDVAEQARELSQRSYSAPSSNLPSALQDLDFEHYSHIKFKDQYSLWRGENLPFDLGFFHQGMHYDLPVKINEVDGEQVRELHYSPDQFDFGDSQVDPASLSDIGGFAGFKINYPIKGSNKQEVMVFLGASYFRAIGTDQRYGSSARGLAIDTALSSGEEFPRFREFWVAKPKSDDRYLVVYALLDSPSTTGAYRFVVRPGDDTIVDVKSQIFLRHQVTKLGVAPLTSMYLFSPSQPSSTLNYRPAIHDASGLVVRTSSGPDDDQWLWRQLMNPRRLSISNIDASGLRGFGLMQRSHDFDDYQDLDDRYDQRPSVWIEPTNTWGEGSVELVEIPTPDETNDNVVAFWRPAQQPEVGTPQEFSYRMTFTRNEQRLQNPDIAWVDQTRRSQGEVRQANLVREPDGSTAYVVDFRGPNLKGLDSNAGVTAEVDAGENGEVVAAEVKRNPVTDGYRMILRVKPNDASRAIDLRAFIKDGTGRRLSETWSLMKQPDA